MVNGNGMLNEVEVMVISMFCVVSCVVLNWLVVIVKIFSMENCVLIMIILGSVSLIMGFILNVSVLKGVEK